MNLYLLLLIFLKSICPGGTILHPELPIKEKQCSVIQKFEPRCFDLTIDLAGDPSKPVREINFNSKETTSTHSMINSRAFHQDIEVGKPWAAEQPGNKRSAVYKCVQHSEKYEDETHGTKFKHYGDSSGTPVNLFIITRRELWTCKNIQDAKPKEVFNRVVTELLSKEPIGGVYYYHGTTITKIKIPKKDDTAEHQFYTTVIREIKYLNPDTGETIKYDGRLKFKTPEAEQVGDEDSRHHYEDFRRLQSSKTRGFSNHVPYPYIITTEGANTILIDKQPLNEKAIDQASMTFCTEDEERKYATLDYLPLWSTILFEQTDFQKTGKITWDENKETPINFLDKFIVTRHVTMVCTTGAKPNAKPSTPDPDEEPTTPRVSHEVFRRVEIEYVGKTVLKEAHVYFGKDVFRYRLKVDSSAGVKSEKSVAIRDVFYFKESDPKTILSINDEKVEIKKLPPPPPKRGPLAWLLSLFTCSGRGE